MKATFTLTLDLPSGSTVLPFKEQRNIKELGKTALISLKLQKEMYTPGYIEAVLQIESNGSISSIDTLDFKSLLGRAVTLSDGEKDLAVYYVIFDYVPEYKPSEAGTSLYLKLNIYSPEHVFSFQKYNKCYVAKKLGADILKSVAGQSDLIKNTDFSHLQHTLIKNEPCNNWMEFIQPYLVQYEETPLDLLKRAANRCGEFLFYENGTWQLGFSPASPVTVSNFSTLSFKKPKDRDVENFFMTNYMKTTDEQEQADEKKNTRGYNGPNEEYLERLTKDKSTFTESFGKLFALNDPGSYLYNASQWLRKDNLYEIVSTIGMDVAKNVIKTGTTLNSKQDAWNKVFITPYETNTEQSTTDNGDTVVCPLSNYNAYKYFGKDFYVTTRELEQKAAEQAIHIDFGTYYQSVLLGDIISVMGKEYIVVKTATACDHKVTTGEAGTYTTFEVDAIPVLDEGYYPTLLEEGTTPPVANQVAYITANNDPSELGRIQFRYPWQPAESGVPSSPWVRVAQPFASKDAAIRFTPQEGDEIMIGYEFGNIERPFMTGALASATNKLKTGENRAAFLENSVANSYVDSGLNGFFNNDFMIKSPTGQYIKFLSPTNQSFANFATSFFPAVNAWLKYIPSGGDLITYAFDSGKELSGGINIGDAYGFFNINMSTEKRKILISSPLGDVNIDAMTGITISAPNGDVKIEGRNIDIAAGNNLTLRSGTNIPKMRKAFSQNFGYNAKTAAVEALSNELVKMASLFDLRLMRSVVDAFFKPIGGTTLIKSNRFLCLEAGKGTTKLPDAAYKTTCCALKRDADYKFMDLKTKDILRSSTILTKYIANMYETARSKVAEAKLEYEYTTLRIIRLWKNFHYRRNFQEIKFDNQEINVDEISQKIDTVAEIIEAACDNTKAVADTHKKLDKLTATDIQENNVFNTDKQQMQTAAEELARIVKDYLTQIGLLNQIKQRVTTVADANFVSNYAELDAYKEDILPFLNIVMQNMFQKFPDLQAGRNLGSPVPFELPAQDKREIIYAVIQELKARQYIDITIPSWYKEITRDDNSVCENNAKWEKYLGCVQHYADTQTEKNQEWKYVFGGMWERWEENRVWDAEIKGEILLSDSSGNTCNINGESINATAVSNIKKELEVLSKI